MDSIAEKVSTLCLRSRRGRWWAARSKCGGRSVWWRADHAPEAVADRGGGGGRWLEVRAGPVTRVPVACGARRLDAKTVVLNYCGDVGVGETWRRIQSLGIHAYFDRVEPKANPVDGLSRGVAAGPCQQVIKAKLPAKLVEMLADGVEMDSKNGLSSINAPRLPLIMSPLHII